MGVPGVAEILLIAVIGVVTVGVPIAIIVLVLYLARSGGGEVARLKAENERLRHELAMAKGEQRP